MQSYRKEYEELHQVCQFVRKERRKEKKKDEKDGRKSTKDVGKGYLFNCHFNLLQISPN